MRNHSRISVPVRGQFGATINYQAGVVCRAPAILQRLGFEWLWRIKEEPYLWRRYWKDGLLLARLVMSQALPVAIELGWPRYIKRNEYKLSIEIEHRGFIIVTLLVPPGSM